MLVGFYSLKFMGKLFTNVLLMLQSQGYFIRTNIVTYTRAVLSVAHRNLLLYI